MTTIRTGVPTTPLTYKYEYYSFELQYEYSYSYQESAALSTRTSTADDLALGLLPWEQAEAKTSKLYLKLHLNSGVRARQQPGRVCEWQQRPHTTCGPPRLGARSALVA
eukprot:scaffold280615_cov44-Prasinocladus_malaysianus.AAC.1